MVKTLKGKVVSTAMKNTVVVEVSFKVPHKLYKKLLIRSKKYKVENRNAEVIVGDEVEIVETKPYSKAKYFKLSKVITSGKKEANS